MAHKRYLIDGIGVASWLFWEFFHVRWKILFSCGGEHLRWGCSHEETFVWCRGQLDIHTLKSPCMGVQGGCKVGMLCKVAFVWWRRQLDIHTPKSPHMEHKVDARWDTHAKWLLCGGGDTSRYTSPKSPLVHTKCIPQLKVAPCRYKVTTLIRCYFDDFQSANDEHLQKFFLVCSSKVTSHPCDMRMPMQGENGHVRWMQGENGHMRWEWPHEVTLCGVGGNSTYSSPKSPHIHAKWQSPTQSCLWLDVTLMMSKVKMMNICRNMFLYTAPKSPHIHTRWEYPHKVRMATWDGHEVRMAAWGAQKVATSCISHLVKFFTPWYLFLHHSCNWVFLYEDMFWRIL